MKRTALKADPEKTRDWQDRSRKPLARDPLAAEEFRARGRAAAAKALGKPKPISPAAPEQRAKVDGAPCVACGSTLKTDPAHITPRSLGGCDDASCVIPLCRSCHSLYDDGHDVGLAEVLALEDYRAEREHMASHLSFPRALHVLTGRRWGPVTDALGLYDAQEEGERG